MSDYLDPENEELLADFFSEAQMQVEMLESNILVLEGDPTSKDAIDEIFRAAHTLKGGSATVQMTEMAGFTHLVEDVFDMIRSDKLRVDDEIIDTLLKSIDVIKAMLEERMEGSVYTEDITDLTNELKAILGKKGSAPVAPASTQTVASPAVSAESEAPTGDSGLSEYEMLELAEKADGKPIYQVTAHLDTDDVMASVGGVQIYSLLKSLGMVLDSVPAFDVLMGDDAFPVVTYYVTFDDFSSNEEMAETLDVGGVVLSVDVKPLGAESASSASSSPETAGELSAQQLAELKEATGKDQSVYKVTAHMDTEDIMASVGGVQIFSLLKNMGTILLTTPAFDLLMGDEVFPEVTYYVHFNEADFAGTDEMADKLSVGGVVLSVEVEKMDLSGVEVAGPTATVVVSTPSSPAPVASAQPVSAQPAKIDVEPSFSRAPAVAKKAGGSGSSASGQVIRIENRRIDQLLNLVSETVINKASLNQINGKLNDMKELFTRIEEIFNQSIDNFGESLPSYIQEHGLDDWNALKEKLNQDMSTVMSEFGSYQGQMKDNLLHFKTTAQSLGRTITDLHESILRIRMVPVSSLFSKFTRVVRDLSKQLNKPVNLHFEGEETELDKSVIDELHDPLMHCVRNSMDHGIEPPEERAEAGKDPEGNILLKASNEGNQIIIEIQDDGKGMNPEVIRQKAIEKGLIPENKIISDHEAVNLIFEPGFSTAAAITDLSGRGVGLDVVRRNIEKLNGTVNITSVYGEGSKFTIRLPLTLAIVQALLVKVKEEIYAIPITSVLESHRISKDQVKVIDGYEMFDLRSQVVSLIRLSDIFKISVVDNKDYYFVIVVGTAERRIGLVVDSLIGEEDLVIKPLKDRYTQTQGIAGATLLGDGQVSLILDVAQLMDLGMQVGDSLRK